MGNSNNNEKNLLKAITALLRTVIIQSLIIVLLIVFLCTGLPHSCNKSIPPKKEKDELKQEEKKDALWSSPDTATIPHNKSGNEIRYGRSLIANTSFYLGPKGKIQHTSNGMNCQNCHLDAGSKPWGNNYSAVASTYPKMRARSGRMESVEKRVNDCFERSLNGHALDSTSSEMRAIVAYITWLGKEVAKGEKPKGTGLPELVYLDRPASAEKGKIVYLQKCQSCHGKKGEGKLNKDNITYEYPPLWGAHSYNVGAGLYRLTRFAGYVKANMPYGASYDKPQLSDEEAWDVAAFVNAQPRPEMDVSKDWPKRSSKPIDNPFGPYTDNFSEKQHKFGPFKPIADAHKKENLK